MSAASRRASQGPVAHQDLEPLAMSAASRRASQGPVAHQDLELLAMSAASRRASQGPVAHQDLEPLAMSAASRRASQGPVAHQDLEPLAMSAASRRASQGPVGTTIARSAMVGPPGLGTAGDERSESPRFPRAGGHNHRPGRDGGAPTTWTSDQTDMMRRVS